ncbi:hypothetical protein [Halorhabdus sp. CUG00001]|uniref:hypothetical protein n=1 Tax=Halorhabdus sp. CUG00001 TaxID=2600297 RepID=UPI00131E25DD|nr:hypothetical protein [Halorhabdus sp. CUG00001]
MIESVEELPITDRDPAEMSNEELTAEWADVADATTRESLVGDEVHNTAHGRRKEIWDEMVSRVDAEPPECPRCRAQAWTQTPGEPKECTECWLTLGFEHEDLIEAIDEYWTTVQTLGGDLDLGGDQA